jgi:2-polyprenyl-3-methyl-5-hydroxy-6-metoxy-1,4-benzoquinol methylase
MNSGPDKRLRVLVALASYGTSNDRYLEQLLRAYRVMSFDVDIVIVSNIEKRPAPGIECRVGLPSKNPWSLPFSHKTLFAERADQYDLFVYSEDDILITERHLRAFLDVTTTLRDDELAGFLRIEKAPDGAINYPDAHAHFHWQPESVRSRGPYTLARFTNEHAACYVLTQAQLKQTINSGGFLVDPHEGKYDLLCTAATDPYTQCGFTKLIPVSHIEDFTVHHLSNKYVDRMGISGSDMHRQIDVLLSMAHDDAPTDSLIDTETRLWRNAFSKSYYDSVDPHVIAMIPASARSILSIGCGWGATEIMLAQKGLQVSAIPLDPVIASNAADQGVDMVYGGLRSARARLEGLRFDCMLYPNVLHLMRDPVGVLSLFRDVSAANAPIIIQSPNMRSIPTMWTSIRNRRADKAGDYDATGVHFTTAGRIREWCSSAGLTIERTVGILHRRAGMLRGMPSAMTGLSMAPDFVSVARRTSTTAAALRHAVGR